MHHKRTIWPLGAFSVLSVGCFVGALQLPADVAAAFVEFSEPQNGAAALILASDARGPPYNSENTGWELTLGGCDAQYATPCSVELAVRLVTEARAAICPSFSGSGPVPSLIEALEATHSSFDADASFGVFVMDANFTFLADRLNPDLVGTAFDGLRASGRSIQPRLRERTQWVVGSSPGSPSLGGFVPHSSTRFSVEEDPTPLPVSTYFERCPNVDIDVFIGLSVRLQALPGEDACSPATNSACNIQNVQRAVGLALLDFLGLKDEETYRGFLYDAAYTNKYVAGSVGVTVSQIEPFSLVLADHTNHSQHGKNDSARALAATLPASQGGGWFKYPVQNSDGSLFYQVGYSVGATFGNTTHTISAGFAHLPQTPSQDSECGTCQPYLMGCAIQILDYLTSHGLTDFLVADNATEAFWRITNLKWLGADHAEAETSNLTTPWPVGFNLAVFDSEGLCVADGGEPQNVGRSFHELGRARLEEDAYSDDEADNLWDLIWARTQLGHGWFRYNESGPRLARVRTMTRQEKRYLLLSSISAAEPEATSQTCDLSAPDPCLAEYLEAEVANWAARLGSWHSDEWTVAAGLLNDFPFSDTMFAGVYGEDWISVVPRYMSWLHASASQVEDLTVENVQLLEAARLAGGGWVSLVNNSESYVHKAYLLSVRPTTGSTWLHLVAGFKGPRQAPSCEGGCGDNQACGENGQCVCPSNALTSIIPDPESCGPIPTSVLVCSYHETDPACANSSDLVTCNNCRGGYYCPTNYVEYECPPGYYCPAGSRSPMPCRVGTWSYEPMATNYTDCEPCAIGYYRDSSMLSGCERCSLGTYQSDSGQSSCTRCEKGSFQNITGQSACASCNNGKTTEGRGYSSPEDCVCPEGTYTVSAKIGEGACVACGEGSSCAGYGREPEALSGYNLHEVRADGLSIFHCLDREHCPGGLVATCAEGRQGIACASCDEGTTPDVDGSCRDCVFLDRLLFISAALTCACGLTALYYGVATADRSKQNHAMLLVIISASQVVTMVQTLNVLASLEVDWGSPLTQMLSRFMIVSFDLTELRLECWNPFSPLQTYILRLSVPLAAVAFVSLLHILSTLFWHGNHYGARLHVLLASLGSVFMAFCISIVLATLQPAQCTDHPNGRWTMRSDMSELCWEGSTHRAMLATAWMASFVPLSFLAAVVHILLAFPRRVREGDVRFLNACMFLVFRYRPGARWCSLFLICRNMLVAVVPAIWDPVTQVVTLQILSMAGLVVVLHYKPCRVTFATVSEAGLCMSTLFAGSLGSFFVENPDRSWVNRLAMGVLLVMALLFPFGVVVGLMRYARALRTKRFHFFLCHHKAGSGALARLTKMELCRGHHALKGDVFIDSDNLENLDKLFDVVANETRALVAFCSAELFRRPWCVGEVTSAYNGRVRVVPLYLTDFTPLTSEFIEDIATVVDLDCVIEQGFAVVLVQTALHWIKSLGGLTMPSTVDARVLRELAKALKYRSLLSPSHTLALHGIVGGRLRPEPLMSDPSTSPQTSTEHSTVPTYVSLASSLSALAKLGSTIPTSTTGPTRSGSSATPPRISEARPSAAFVVDTESCEAVCAARILIDLVSNEVGQALHAPRILQDAVLDRKRGLELFPSVDRLALLCTVGCWSSHRFITDAVHGYWTGLEMLPVIVDENYRFPTEIFYRDLEDVGSSICRMYEVREQVDIFRTIVSSIFKNIASHFHVLGSIDILETQAESINKRLKRPLLEVSKNSNDGTCSVDERAWCHDFVRVVTDRWDAISEDFN